MAVNYLERLRKNRELKVVVGRWTFTARRPTDVEAAPIFDPKTNTTLADVARDYVIGWDGVVEDDVIGGGGTDPVPFSLELWREWSSDRPDIWETIGTRVTEAYLLHRKQIEDAGKN